MTSYNDRFTGSVINPSTVSFLEVELNVPLLELSWPIVYQENPFVVASYMSVIASAPGYVLQMPDATQTSVGQTTMIANVSTNPANTFSVTTNTGSVIQANIAVGDVYFLILTDNSTPEGVWEVTLLGATQTPASASALAGYGLTVLLNGKLNTYTPITTLNVPYTVLASDRAKLFKWVGGTGNITLPDAATVLNGFSVSFNNLSAVGGVLTIVPQPGQTIDGFSNFSINVEESSQFTSDGSNWITFGYGNNAIAQVSLLELNVTPGGTFTLTPEQCVRQVQNFTGGLTQNVIIEVPSITNYYIVRNATTGSFTLTYKMIGGATNTIVPQGQQLMLYCDSFDVRIVPSVFLGAIAFADGSAADPSITFVSDATTGLFLNNPQNLGITAEGTLCANFNSDGLQVINAIEVKSGADTVFNADSTGVSAILINGAPAYSFIDNTTSGIGYTAAAGGSLNLYVGGTVGAKVSSTTIEAIPISGSPSFAFIGNTTSGIGFTETGKGSLNFYIDGDVCSNISPTGISALIVAEEPSFFFVGNETSGMGFNASGPSLQLFVGGTVCADIDSASMFIPAGSYYAVDNISIYSLMEVYSS